MTPGHGLPDVHLSSLALDGSPAWQLLTALELERCASGRPCLMCCGVNPTFYIQMSIPEQPLRQVTWFLVFWCSCNKYTSLQKNWIESIQWLVRFAFWVISLKKISKWGAKMGQNPTHPTLSFNIQYQFATYKKYVDGVLGVERRVVGS